METNCDWMSATRLKTESHHAAAVTVVKTASSSAKAFELADTRLSLAPCTPGITVTTQHNGETKKSRFSLHLVSDSYFNYRLVHVFLVVHYTLKQPSRPRLQATLMSCFKNKANPSEKDFSLNNADAGC